MQTVLPGQFERMNILFVITPKDEIWPSHLTPVIIAKGISFLWHIGNNLGEISLTTLAQTALKILKNDASSWHRVGLSWR